MKFFYSLFLFLLVAFAGSAQKYIYGGQRDSMRPIAASNTMPTATTPAEKALLKKKDSLYKLQQDSAAFAIDSIAKADTVTATMKLYREQTGNEQFAKNDKGAAVFFNMPMATHNNEFYYGFFDNAGKGTILKVYNPGADKTIYVKVLGPLPKTKQYYNSILGISNKAKEALGATDDKVWCDVFYASGW